MSGKDKYSSVLKNYVRVRESDKAKLAEYINKARGMMSMSEFARRCEINPSTLSRILNQKIVGNSSDVLILKIAENADPNSGITLDALLDAHGMVPIHAEKSKEEIDELYFQCLERTRMLLLKELMVRNFTIQVSSERTFYNALSHKFRAHFEIFTNDFTEDGTRTQWLFEMWPDIAKVPVTNIRKKILMILGLYYIGEIKAQKFSFVVYNEKTYKELVESMDGYSYPNCFSIIYVDLLNNRVVSEEVFPSINSLKSPKAFFEIPEVEYTSDADFDDFLDDDD